MPFAVPAHCRPLVRRRFRAIAASGVHSRLFNGSWTAQFPPTRATVRDRVRGTAQRQSAENGAYRQQSRAGCAMSSSKRDDPQRKPHVRARCSAKDLSGAITARRERAPHCQTDFPHGILPSRFASRFRRRSLLAFLGSSASAQDLRFRPENTVFLALRQESARVCGIRAESAGIGCRWGDRRE
jgi:hypothetical protein